MSDKRMTFEEWLADYNTVTPLTDRDRNNLRDGWHAAQSQLTEKPKWIRREKDSECEPPFVYLWENSNGKLQITATFEITLSDLSSSVTHYIPLPPPPEPEKSDAEKAWEDEASNFRINYQQISKQEFIRIFNLGKSSNK